MYFGIFVGVKGYHIDTVDFPAAAKKHPFKGRGVYELTGKVTEEFDCITVEIEKMEKLAIIQDPRYADIPKKIMT